VCASSDGRHIFVSSALSLTKADIFRRKDSKPVVLIITFRKTCIREFIRPQFPRAIFFYLLNFTVIWLLNLTVKIPSSWTVCPWICRHYNPSKFWELFIQQHGFTSQKTWISGHNTWLNVSGTLIANIWFCNKKQQKQWQVLCGTLCTIIHKQTAVFILPTYHAGVCSGHEIKFKAFLHILVDGDEWSLRQHCIMPAHILKHCQLNQHHF
jgi:hypothetical protein